MAFNICLGQHYTVFSSDNGRDRSWTDDQAFARAQLAPSNDIGGAARWIICQQQNQGCSRTDILHVGGILYHVMIADVGVLDATSAMQGADGRKPWLMGSLSITALTAVGMAGVEQKQPSQS